MEFTGCLHITLSIVDWSWLIAKPANYNHDPDDPQKKTQAVETGLR
jgi:hypothetical protein